MEFALDLFGPNPITWKMTVFSSNLITMKILSVVWILDYPNPSLLNFFCAPHGIGLIEVVLCDSSGMNALKLKWAMTLFINVWLTGEKHQTFILGY